MGYTFLDVFLAVESIKSGPEAISSSFPGWNREKPIFRPKIGPKNVFFLILTQLISLAINQNLFIHSSNIAAHIGKRILKIGVIFPG